MMSGALRAAEDIRVSEAEDEGRLPVSARSTVAVLLSRFPLITETFILREVIELERQGQPVRLVPLLREDPDVVHTEAKAWVERALFTPYISGRTIAANLKTFLYQPRTYVGLLGRLVIGTISSPNLLLRTLALFPKSVHLAQRLQKEGVRHIHAHFATHPTTAALIVAELSGMTFSFTAHAHDLFVRQQLLEWKIEKASWVRLISEFNRQFLIDKYPRIEAEKLKVIHTGVVTRSHGSETDADDWDSDRGSGTAAPFLILCVAALKSYKGLEVLIDACQEMVRRGVNFQCRIIGHGPLRGKLEQQISAHGIGDFVGLRGALPQNRVAKQLKECDVVVQPSVVAADGQMEGIPVSLMEALAAGKPVVASRLSGIPELVVDGHTGVLVKPGDVEELVAALTRLSEDRELGSSLAGRGRRHVRETFDLSRNVGALLQELDRERAPIRDVEAALSGFPPEELSGSGSVLVEWLRRRRDSTIVGLRPSAGSGTSERILKIHHRLEEETRPASERARHEWKVLEHLQRASAESESRAEDWFGYPRKVSFSSEHGALLMDPIVGTPLNELIRRARRPGGGRDLVDPKLAMRGSGEWLRTFQERMGPLGAELPAADRLRRAILDQIGGIDVDRGTREAVMRQVDSLLKEAEIWPDLLRPQHGDFWPGNIFWSEGQVSVLDFEGAYDGLAYEDAAYFLEHLRLYLDYPSLRKRWRALESSFLMGFLGDEEPQRSWWEICRIAAAVRILRFGNNLSSGWLGRRRRRLLLQVLEFGS